MDSRCKQCGILNPIDFPKCLSCGEIQDTFHYKSRIAAATLAFFGGMFGFHRFFLGQWWGIFYLLFFWTYIPWLVGIIEGIIFLNTTQHDWNKKYNQGVSAGKEKGTVVVIIAILIPIFCIIGILAAIAIPAYQGYLVKAKMAETQVMANTVMTAVEVYALSEEQWPQDIYDLPITGRTSNSQVSAVEVNNGVIYVRFSPDSGVNGNMILIPEPTDRGIYWDCEQSTVSRDYLPSKCQFN
ncbi:NINE protein [Alteromonas sp. M12]|uniref:NINE protein n=1 Tax=Alteromonas sp. M12 TaxID=3135644 RepID=UPI00319E5C59